MRRTLAFLLAAVPLGAVGVLVLIAGWTLTICLAITPAVVPVLLGFRAVVGQLAAAEARLARVLVGAAAVPAVAGGGGRNFWRRGYGVLVDPAFWKQQLYLLLRALLGWTLAIVEISLLAAALGAIALPIYYRWSDMEIAGRQVDTLPHALLFVPAGLLLLGAAVWLLRPIGALWRRLANALLGGGRVPVMTPAEARARRLHALALHAGVYGLVNALLIVIWALTSRGYFWPVWTLLALGLPLAIHAWVVLVRERPELARRQHVPPALAHYEGVALSFCLFFIVVWAVSGAGYFWPVWPILGFAVGFAVQAFVLAMRRLRRGEERIETLETSRAGAVDLQESELRRIERDLHDGAQARLVDVGMSLGLAEQKLRTDPGAAQELLAEARRGAHEALEELRDLARGIHPPVLTDRGLDAAVRSLVDRSPLDVHVDVELDGRPPEAVESAAYFVVAEAVAKREQARGRGAPRHPDSPLGRCGRGRRRDRGRRARRRRRVRPRNHRSPSAGAGPRRHAGRLEPGRRADRRARGPSMRVVIAEDLALLRDGLTRLLRDNGFDVVAAVRDGDALVHAVLLDKPDVAIVDIRLPPTFRDEGLRAALTVRERRPGTAVLVVSQYVEQAYAAELLADGRGGVGYLLKDRIMDVDDFVDAVRRVADGGTALDPDVVAQLFSRLRAEGPLERLTPREREVLSLMAEGRSNAAIARRLVLTVGAVEKHVASILAKLRLPPSEDDHRRVLAVLTYLQGSV